MNKTVLGAYSTYWAYSLGADRRLVTPLVTTAQKNDFRDSRNNSGKFECRCARRAVSDRLESPSRDAHRKSRVTFSDRTFWKSVTCSNNKSFKVDPESCHSMSHISLVTGGEGFLILPKYIILSHKRREKNIKSELGYYMA
jgi:hypothetical protein